MLIVTTVKGIMADDDSDRDQWTKVMMATSMLIFATIKLMMALEHIAATFASCFQQPEASITQVQIVFTRWVSECTRRMRNVRVIKLLFSRSWHEVLGTELYRKGCAGVRGIIKPQRKCDKHQYEAKQKRIASFQFASSLSK